MALLTSTTRPAVPAVLEKTRIVAILRRTDSRLAVQTAEALLRGGVAAIEVTLNTAGALDMLRAMREAVGDRALLGAGTVLDLASAEAALDAGAEFIVSPHTDIDIVRAMAARGVPCMPGAFSPTEVVAAWAAGASVVKLFPTGPVGAGYLKDLRGPLGHIPLLPTGGVTLDNAPTFIAAGAWGLGLGSALVDPELVSAKRFDDLSARSAAFAAIAAQASRRLAT
jgi:2-dehydro-3-deoxyphosphogluconate aldolase/(4S)-4-hydroxy-2-oxoglutarate aldolase